MVVDSQCIFFFIYIYKTYNNSKKNNKKIKINKKVIYKYKYLHIG